MCEGVSVCVGVCLCVRVCVSVCVCVCVCVQVERPKTAANLSLSTSHTLFASDDDSPTFDLFAPSAVSAFITISFECVCVCVC